MNKNMIRKISIVLLALVLIAISPINVSAAELVTNGGFETGDFTGWTTLETGGPLVPWTVVDASDGGSWFPPYSPQEGTYEATNGFDGAGPMEFIMYQDVTIPAGVTTFSWMERIQWDFTLGATATQARIFEVQVHDLSTGDIEIVYSFSTGIQNPTGDTGWQSHNVDVSSFAGSTVSLYFVETIPEDYTGPAQFEIDAISLINQPSADIPEFPTIALPVISIVGLMFLFQRRTDK